MFDPRERANAFLNRSRLDARQPRCCGSSQNIFDVVISAQADDLALEEDGLGPVAPEHDFVATQKATIRYIFLAAKPIYPWLAWRVARGHGIVRIDDGVIFLRLIRKHACFGTTI